MCLFCWGMGILNVCYVQYVLGFTWSFQNLLWQFHIDFLICRSYLRNIATIEDLTPLQIMSQTVSFVWLPLISHSVQVIAWYTVVIFIFIRWLFSVFFNCEHDLICISLTGNTMRSFLSFWLFAKVDGHKDGMPNLPAFITTSLKKIFHSIYIT